MSAHGIPDPFGSADGDIEFTAAHENKEFIAAPAAERIGIPDMVAHDRGEFPQDSVAAFMAVRIVNGLEVIDIDVDE